MSEFVVDSVYVCMYCGELMDSPSDKALEMFGEKAITCCEHPMCKLEEDKLFVVMKAFDKLRENIEKRVLKGVM